MFNFKALKKSAADLMKSDAVKLASDSLVSIKDSASEKGKITVFINGVISY